VLEAAYAVKCGTLLHVVNGAKFWATGVRDNELGQGARCLKQCITVQPAAISALSHNYTVARRRARFLQAQPALERALQQMKGPCGGVQERGPHHKGATHENCGARESRYEASVPPAALSLRPSHRATTGVSATVGGKRMGDSALCAAYAMAAVPTRSLVSDAFRPTRCSSAATFTPGRAAGRLSPPAYRTQPESVL